MRSAWVVMAGLALQACGITSCADVVEIPGAGPGIGFDDLGYSSRLQRVLVPGGRSGRLDLIDPGSREVTSIEGFSTSDAFNGGHDNGPTAVDDGLGFLYVLDRDSDDVRIVDVDTKSIVGRVALSSGGDYVRFVEATRELWVTDPGSERIEVFAMSTDSPPVLTHSAFIDVKGGPESLVVNQPGGKAYTHQWEGKTVEIDVRTRAVSEPWSNGCGSSRGIALDASRALLLTGCVEGRVTAVKLDEKHAMPGSIRLGGGVDVVGYNPSLAHLYVASATTGLVSVIGVEADGALLHLGSFRTAFGASCAVADDHDQVWVCDPKGGRMLVHADPYPAN